MAKNRELFELFQRLLEDRSNSLGCSPTKAMAITVLCNIAYVDDNTLDVSTEINKKRTILSFMLSSRGFTELWYKEAIKDIEWQKSSELLEEEIVLEDAESADDYVILKSIINEQLSSVSPKSYKSSMDISSVCDDLYDAILGAKQAKVAPGKSAKTNTSSSKPIPTSPIFPLLEESIKLRDFLLDNVYGQDAAVQSIVDGYFKIRLFKPEDTSSRPALTYLFAGPSGVGKTFIAQKFAEAINRPFKRFDMSSYSNEDGKSTLLGIHSSFRNAHQGELTSFVNENPSCVILFDELEKASSEIIEKFLQILDAGILKDLHTEKNVSFKNVIIMMTTNVGKSLYEDNHSASLSATPRSSIIRALREELRPDGKGPYFPPAICTRFASGNVLMFNHLEPHNLVKIIDREFKRCADAFTQNLGIKVTYDNRLTSILLFKEGGLADGRSVAGQAGIFFNSELFELLRLYNTEEEKKLLNKLNHIHIGINSSDTKNPVVMQLSSNDRVRNVLVLTDSETEQVCTDTYNNINLVFAQTAEAAVKIAIEKEISLYCIDVGFGEKKKSKRYENIEDAASEGVALFNLLAKGKEIPPIFIIETAQTPIDKESLLSFTARGARGKINLVQGNSDFADKLKEGIAQITLQEYAKSLALKNTCVAYSTAQTFNAKSNKAEIILYDMRQERLVELDNSINLITDANKPSTRFSDVFGAKEAKRELQEVLADISNLRESILKGKRIPRGILLYGPSGTGKTMLAKALSGEADLAFISCNASDFYAVNNETPMMRVKKIFKSARGYAPTILFIDEIDLIGKNRQLVSDSGILNAILTEMDGFDRDPTKPVLVLGATNIDVDSNILDPALLRRFERRILVGLPDNEERKDYLLSRIKSIPCSALAKKDIDVISKDFAGCSFAVIDSIINHAVSLATRLNVQLDRKLFKTSLEHYLYGETKSIPAEQMRKTAVHEAGHALILHLANQTPSYITVISRADSLGYVKPESEEDAYTLSSADMITKIRVALAGRAAEQLFCDKSTAINTGAYSDLQKATNYAVLYISYYGMSETFGMLSIDINKPAYAGVVPEIITEAKHLVAEQYDITYKILEENKSKMEKIIEKLVTSMSLDKEELIRLLK